MHLPLRRVFEEKRRLVIPVLAGLALNAVLYAGVIYPLGARTRSTEVRARAAAEQLRAAEREEADARGIALARDRNEVALNAFYKDILPATHAQARHVAFLRLTQLADQHNLEQSRRSTDPKQEKGSTLARLQISMTLRGDYEDIRRFIYDVEAGSDFIVIDSVALQQGEEPGSPLVLRLLLSTYYRAVPDGQ